MSYYSFDNHDLLKQRFKEEFPDVEVGNVAWSSRYYLHFIQFKPKGYPEEIHFEYHVTQDSDWSKRRGVIDLHLEPVEENYDFYRRIGINLMHRTVNLGIEPRAWFNIPCGSFRLANRNIVDVETLVDEFRDFYEIVHQFIMELLKSKKDIRLDAPYSKPRPRYPASGQEEDVTVGIMPLKEVMTLNLTLPDYQRDYCWEDKHITDLWHSLTRIVKGKPFHLGTIILHSNHGKCDIIDGQQRLVTLTLLLRALGYDGYLPLLNESYTSTEAQEHISNCKYIVQELVRRCKDNENMLVKIADDVSFTVLTVNENRLDLAYTFFSNQNSKGVPLSDFDLLKAHHLRFVSSDAQSEHMATKWNSLSQLPPVYKECNALYRALGTHVYRLRRWMRRNDSEENRYRYIRDEYQSAVTMPDIPPFGERFHFYEKIQGGTHFFVYAETFIHHYLTFISASAIKSLHTHITQSRHEIFADVMETLLFGYYLKFGNQYLTEALYCISRLMTLHRYNSGHVASDGAGVRNFANSTEVILMIDQASSPTFFLAEALAKHDYLSRQQNYPINSGLDLSEPRGVKWEFYEALKVMFHELMPEISDNIIRNKIIEEYGK